MIREPLDELADAAAKIAQFVCAPTLVKRA